MWSESVSLPERDLASATNESDSRLVQTPKQVHDSLTDVFGALLSAEFLCKSHSYVDKVYYV